MKVLLVTEYYPPKIFGGGELSAETLANSLAENGLNVKVLTSYFPGLKKNEEKNGVKISRLLKTGLPNTFIGNLKRMFFMRSLKKELLKLNKKEDFDAVHFLNTSSIPSFKINKRTIATINGYRNFCPKGNLFYKDKEVCHGCNFCKYLGCVTKSEYIGRIKNNFLIKYNVFFHILNYLNYLKLKNSLKNVNQFISISDFITEMLVRHGIKREHITKIYNIANLKDNNLKFPISQKGVLITYIGNLEKIKGVELLIKAFNKVENQDAKLLIFGDGPEKGKLKKLASERITFFGKVDYKYIPSIYKQSDIIVQPALWPEPFSRIILEATYFGKPIIATDVGGNGEGVVDGKNGFLINNEISDWKERLKSLIENINLRKSMSKESGNIYKKKFSLTNNINKIIEVYGK